jgi:EAL domain-containing protein (putative c-di-GMP-specific phosphodiesterase class I)
VVLAGCADEIGVLGAPADMTSPPVSRPIDWPGELARVLDEPGRVRPAFQPLVDLQRGVVCGWEMLARFDSPVDAAPPDWFAAAERHGVAGRLEAALIEAGLTASRALPPNCFLTINVAPTALTTPEVRAAFGAAGSLGGVVVEITEQAAVDDYEQVGRALDDLRARGAAIAVDDAGAGYASLSHIVALRPQFVKLDRRLISDVDVDEAKVAVIEAFGSFANRIDAWIVAEGVERAGELDALVRLGVPLAQGFGLGRPSRPMQGIDRSVAERIRERSAARDAGSSLAALAEPVPPVDAGAQPAVIAAMFASNPALTHLPIVDERYRPIALLPRSAAARVALERPPLRVDGGSTPAEAARRAMTRDPAERFEPLVLCDERGRYTGLVRIERLIDELASLSDPTHKGASQP